MPGNSTTPPRASTDPPQLLCMWCARPASEDWNQLACSRDCLAQLAASLGITPSVAGGGELVGYAATVADPAYPSRATMQEVGLVYPDDALPAGSPLRHPPPTMIVRYYADMADAPRVHVWLARLRLPDDGLVVEARWHPATARTLLKYRGVPLDQAEEAWAFLRDVRRLWRERFDQAGRPPGAHDPAERERQRAEGEEVARLRREGRTWPEVGRTLGLAQTTAWRRLKDYRAAAEPSEPFQ